MGLRGVMITGSWESQFQGLTECSSLLAVGVFAWGSSGCAVTLPVYTHFLGDPLHGKGAKRTRSAESEVQFSGWAVVCGSTGLFLYQLAS